MSSVAQALCILAMCIIISGSHCMFASASHCTSPVSALHAAA